tara:strand:+ start:171 stop:1184 length:1014 start_codon:yes stop_codon:yes gene_type:complete
MSDLRINNITDRTGGSGPVFAGISTVSTTGAFTVPVGPTEMRGGRGRGVFAGSATPSYTNVMDYVEIATTGNATDFGDLDTTWYNAGGCASSTRGIWFPGYDGSNPVSSIYYVTISSKGGVTHFGDTLNASRNHSGACSDSTRGVRAEGYKTSTSSRTNVLEFITIATTGDSADFGELNRVVSDMAGSFASPTRGFFCGGKPETNIIDYITIQTKGNAIDFGDLIDGTRAEGSGASNTTRGLCFGGSGPGANDTIQYITMATLGNAVDFGNLHGDVEASGACASSTRGLNAGGTTPTKINTIDYVTIASAGNATDFGDRTTAGFGVGACSDVHGGLG